MAYTDPHADIFATFTNVVFGTTRPAHHADTRPILEDDIAAAIRGLQMARLPAADLTDLCHEHAHRDAFASAVIVVGAARRLAILEALDLTAMCSSVLAAIHRDPSLVTRLAVDAEIDRRIAFMDEMLRNTVPTL